MDKTQYGIMPGPTMSHRITDIQLSKTCILFPVPSSQQVQTERVWWKPEANIDIHWLLLTVTYFQWHIYIISITIYYNNVEVKMTYSNLWCKRSNNVSPVNIQSVGDIDQWRFQFHLLCISFSDIYWTFEGNFIYK